MSNPSYVAEPHIQRLPQLVREIADGFIQVPRFQRPIVWTDDQRLELFRSIREGTPIGSILVWRTSFRDVHVFDRLGPHRLERPTGTAVGYVSYLLDGHQRLSTLFGALHPLTADSSNINDSNHWLVYFDLEREEFTFEPSREKTESRKMLPLYKLLDSRQLLAFQRDLDRFEDRDELIRRADDLATAIQEYKLPVIPIVTDSINVATRTFQRINSEGTPMNHVHMVAALTWTSDFDLGERLSAIREEVLAPLGWGGFEDRMLLSACKVTLGLDLLEGDADEIAKGINVRKEVLEETAQHVARAASFLKDRCHVGSPRLVPYSYVPVLIAEVFRQNPQPTEPILAQLERWFWWVCYAYFSISANSSRLRRALEMVRRLAVGQNEAMEPLDQLDSIPSRFDFRLARCKLLSLLMAHQHQLLFANTAVSWQIDADRLLADRGYEALQSIFTGKQLSGELLSSPGNRVLISPERIEDLRRALANESFHDLESLSCFTITEDAWLSFQTEGPASFVQQRRRDLETLEIQLGREKGFLR